MSAMEPNACAVQNHAARREIKTYQVACVRQVYNSCSSVVDGAIPLVHGPRLASTPAIGSTVCDMRPA
jgi:hypothetical protein